jgi:ribose transport system substrate-binding protein
MLKKILKLAVATSIAMGVGFAAHSQEGGFDDGVSAKYYKTMKGKKIIYVPISMGMDLAAAWGAGLQRLADQNGMELVIRDPNWSVDQGVQAITQAIAENPDVLIVQNLDLQAYSRSLKQAVDAGIRVMTVNVKATTNTTAHVGVDFYRVIEQNARQIMKVCSPKEGGNGKVALMQVSASIPINYIGMKAIENLKKEFPDVTIVADQAANVDATKAHSIAATVLRQHPDLCGISACGMVRIPASPLPCAKRV